MAEKLDISLTQAEAHCSSECDHTYLGLKIEDEHVRFFVLLLLFLTPRIVRFRIGSRLTELKRKSCRITKYDSVSHNLRTIRTILNGANGEANLKK